MGHGRKRRGSVTHRRYGDGYIVIAETPKIERVGRSHRAAATIRRTKIEDVTRVRIRSYAADGWSLRQIGRALGISHEAVRSVLRDASMSLLDS
jgi:hypothetical protein